jgi:hypothetical protein
LKEIAQGKYAVPVRGIGQTERRFESRANWAAIDLSLGRLAEGHRDAIAGQRAADLYVYLAQHHGAQGAVGLGRLALEHGKWD